MPNYCQNKLTLKGKETKKLLNFIKSQEREFDFSNVIPMPPSILNTERGSLSFASEAVAIYLKDRIITSHLRWLADREKVKIEEIPNLIEKWENEKKINVSLGARIVQNRIDYNNCGDWYEWSIENWGTKWQPSNIYSNNEIIEFETAWSPATPVIEKLSSIFPDVEIEYKYFEPGVSLAGIEKFKNGDCYMIDVYDYGEEGFASLAEEFGYEICEDGEEYY